MVGSKLAATVAAAVSVGGAPLFFRLRKGGKFNSLLSGNCCRSSLVVVPVVLVLILRLDTYSV